MEKALLIAAVGAFVAAVVFAGVCIVLFARKDVPSAIGYLRRRGKRREKARNRSMEESSERPTRSLAEETSERPTRFLAEETSEQPTSLLAGEASEQPTEVLMLDNSERPTGFLPSACADASSNGVPVRGRASG